jgi:hypothetical protein
MSEEKLLTRRKLLYGAGLSVCGIALGGTMGTLLTGCSQKQPAAVASPGPAPVPSAPEFPWTYQKLDVKECQEERIKTTWQGAEALVPPKVFSA